MSPRAECTENEGWVPTQQMDPYSRDICVTPKDKGQRGGGTEKSRDFWCSVLWEQISTATVKSSTLESARDKHQVLHNH